MTSTSTHAGMAGTGHPFVSALEGSGLIPSTILESLVQRVQSNVVALEGLLLAEGYLSEEQLQSLKAQAAGMEFIDLQKAFISDEMLSILPRPVAEAQRAVPFARNEQEIAIAVVDPEQGVLRRLLEKKLGVRVRFALTTEAALGATLKRYSTDFHARVTPFGEHGKRGADDSVVELVDALILHGIRQKASDIHIEPTAHNTIVRERIDGLLHRSVSFSKEIHKRLTQRIKVMANLATDEHAIPQDGKITYWTPEEQRVDIRVSIVPTTQGEKIALRLLVTDDTEFSFAALGCADRDAKLLEEQTKLSWGMILVTGPTGSGKSTTLYTIMQRLRSETVNLSTIEDPVEYEVAGANQLQVNEKTGLTFAIGLRALLRQDPNIILVGEIRDRETATIAVNAAMTGHLVLSTLHTNNAATAIPRLIDMGVEPFLIASTVNVVVAQRLVRKLCPACTEVRQMPLSDLRDSLPPEILEKLSAGGAVPLHQAKGCAQCGGKGYTGRFAIFEVLVMTSAVRDLIMRKAPADVIQQEAARAGMTTMIDDGISKVLSGQTSIQELLRVIRT